MKRNLTQKQELFCLNIFEGMTQREAWVNAGYSGNYPVASIDSNACQLANNTRIKQRIEALNNERKERILKETIADENERRQVLTEIIRGRLSQFSDLVEVKPEDLKSAAIQEVRISSFKGGKEGRATRKMTTLKLRDPIAAISELNKMEGVYSVPPNVNYNTQINIFTNSKDTQKLVEGINQRFLPEANEE